MTISDEVRAAIERLPRPQQELLWVKLKAVEACTNQSRGGIYAEARKQADLLGVSTTTVQRWISIVRQHGPTGLIPGHPVS